MVVLSDRAGHLSSSSLDVAGEQLLGARTGARWVWPAESPRGLSIMVYPRRCPVPVTE